MIEFSHVYKNFEGSAHVLSDVNLKIGKGEFVFLTGPSGAGKTTLFNLLAGFDRPTSGQVQVGGLNVGKLSRTEVAIYRRRLGVVFQDFRLLPDRSVLENVALPLKILREKGATAEKRLENALTDVGLKFKREALPQQLSGGEKQRVAIARALVHQPSLLIADEPTGNLDPNLSEEIMNLFVRANAQGTTVVVASHDLNLVRRLARRVIELRGGRIMGGV